MNPARFLETPSPMTVKDRLAENQCPRCGRQVEVTTYWARHLSEFQCDRCGKRYYDDNTFEEIIFDPNPFGLEYDI